MKKFHYSWIICIISVIILFSTGGLINTAFSVYFPYMRNFSGITNTQCSTIQMVRNITALVSLNFIDRILNRINVKVGIIIGVFLVAVAFLYYSISNSFWGYCFAAAIGGIGYTFSGMIPISLLINRWFHTHRGFAMGLCTAGTGIATIIMPPVIALLVESLSLSAAFALEAGFVFCIAFFVCLTLKNTPEEKGLSPLKNNEAKKETKVSDHESCAQPSSMLYIYAAVLLLAFGVYGSMGNLSLLLTTQGFSSITVAFLVSLTGVAMTLGKCLFGLSADRVGSFKTASVFFFCLVTGIGMYTLFGTIQSFPFVVIGIFLYGTGNALATVALPIFSRDLAGKYNYTKTAKQIQMAYQLGSIAVGPFPGLIADGTGSYIPAYALLTIFLAFSMVFTLASLHIRSRQLFKEIG